MASLASFTTLYVTAIRLDGGEGLRNIVAVRWDAGDQRPEEASAADFIGWLARDGARAFVRAADGERGPRIRVDDAGQLHLRSRADDDQPDALLSLPRWAGKSARKHLNHR